MCKIRCNTCGYTGNANPTGWDKVAAGKPCHCPECNCETQHSRVPLEQPKEAEPDQAVQTLPNSLHSCSIMSQQTSEHFQCPECGGTYTHLRYAGAYIGGGELLEQVCQNGYCPDCMVKALCAQFGVKLDKKEKPNE